MTYSQVRQPPPNTVPTARPTRSEVLAALPELVPPGASIYNQIEAANLIEATIRRWWPPEPASQSDGPAVPTGREPASVAGEPSAADRARRPAPVPPTSATDVWFEFVVSDPHLCTLAGGIAPTYAQALCEGQHYLAQYLQDGPHTLELRRVEVLLPRETSNE